MVKLHQNKHHYYFFSSEILINATTITVEFLAFSLSLSNFLLFASEASAILTSACCCCLCISKSRSSSSVHSTSTPGAHISLFLFSTHSFRSFFIVCQQSLVKFEPRLLNAIETFCNYVEALSSFFRSRFIVIWIKCYSFATEKQVMFCSLLHFSRITTKSEIICERFDDAFIKNFRELQLQLSKILVLINIYFNFKRIKFTKTLLIYEKT